MSWLARSIVNSLKLDDDDEEDDHYNTSHGGGSPSKSKPEDAPQHQQIESSSSPPSSSSSPTTLSPSSEALLGRGVKEDLSELTKTLTRQFWGVASFLAPPPPPDLPDSIRSEPSDQIAGRGEPFDQEALDAAAISGIRSDFAEIGGRFKTGISKLSSNKAVSEITKIASNFLQFGSDQEYSIAGAVGVTEEVLAFVKNIALHPETWLDFPLSEDDEDDDADDFDMSDAQQEHALAIERLAPELTAIRIEICPGYMSEGHFWKIYFVLLHPRLDQHDAELLSTPQIVKARAMLTHELQNRVKTKPEPDWSAGDAAYSNETATSSHEEHLSVPSVTQSEPLPLKTPLKTSVAESTSTARAAHFEAEKHSNPNTEIQIIDKSVVEDGPANQTKYHDSVSASSKVLDDKYEDDGDDWLKEESSEVGGTSATTTTIPIGNEEDVSFSDLEEDDDDEDVPTSHKKVTYSSDSSTKDAREWVQLSRSSTDSAKDIEAVGSKQAGSEQVSRDTETKESNDWLDVDDIDVR